MTKKILLIILSLLLPPLVWASDVSISIEGLHGEAEKNVESYISSIPNADHSTSLRFQSRLKTMVTNALNAVGYYHPQIDISLTGKSLLTGKENILIKVNKGEPVIIRDVDIKITGDALNDPFFRKVIRNDGLIIGDRLNHQAYENTKSQLQSLALQRGYFDGQFVTKQLEIIPSLNEAIIHLHFDSGMRYQYGKSMVNGSQIEKERIISIQPFKKGEFYDAIDISKYNQSLSTTGWFSSVYVGPDLSYLGKRKELPIDVSLSPEVKNKIETGIGYSTDLGFKGTLKWKKPWVNARGNSFDSSFSISKPEQYITLSYQIPLENVLKEYYRVQYGMKKLNNLDTNSLESNLSLERHWVLDSGWHPSIYVRYLLENYEQGQQADSDHYILPGANFSYLRKNNGLVIYTADRYRLNAEFANKELFSSTNVVRFLGDFSWIRSLGQNQRGIVKINGGMNVAEDFDKLPPSLRFFAGGDNSIRGYGYESISPVDSAGLLTGGKFLLTSSLEYQVRIYGNWWLAGFYDIGDAFNNTPKWKRGVGTGIRWISPIGPIRLDFGWGLDRVRDQKEKEVKLYFSLGPEL